MGVLMDGHIGSSIFWIEENGSLIDKTIYPGIITLQHFIFIRQLLQNALGSIPVRRDLQTVGAELFNHSVNNGIAGLAAVRDFEVPIMP